MATQTDLRNKDFIQCCTEMYREMLSENRNDKCNKKGYIVSPCTVCKIAIEQPAKSFYINEETISKIINRFLLNGLPVVNSISKQREVDIINEYIKLHGKYKSIFEISCIITQMPAPRFYIGLSHAQKIYYDTNRSIRSNTK